MYMVLCFGLYSWIIEWAQLNRSNNRKWAFLPLLTSFCCISLASSAPMTAFCSLSALITVSFLYFEIQCKLSQYFQACIQLKIRSFLQPRPEDSSLGSGKEEAVMVYFFTISFLHPISQGLFLLSQCLVWFSWLLSAGQHCLCYGWLFGGTFLWASQIFSLGNSCILHSWSF